MPEIHPLNQIVHHIEETLGKIYGFTHDISVSNHLVSREQLKTFLGAKVETTPEFHSRAGVFVVQEGQGDDFFIGVHVDEKVQFQLNQDSPLKAVHIENLDSFWVLIEEISHFHLIVNRVFTGKKVSKLELEWQGEIDKLVVSALTLFAQHGDPCIEELQVLLHESSSISAVKELEGLYTDANLFAIRFWRRILKNKHLLDKKAIELLREFYWAPWTYKYSKLSKI